MHQYDIRDVWMGLKLASKNFLMATIVMLFGGMFLLSLSMTPEAYKSFSNQYAGQYFLGIIGVVFIQSIIIYLANRRYLIDLENGLVTFPRSDMENSIIAIIFLFPYWNLMRTVTISCSDRVKN